MEIFRLKRGDKIVEILARKVKDMNSGVILGLGALDEAILKLYNVKSKEFLKKKIRGPLEIGSFVALIAKDPDGKTGIHPHVVVSGKDFVSYSGHLEEAVVGATFEGVIMDDKRVVKRYRDLKIGLDLLDV